MMQMMMMKMIMNMMHDNDAKINYQNMMDTEGWTARTNYKNNYNAHSNNDQTQSFEGYLKEKYSDINMNTYSAETQQKHSENEYMEDRKAWNV